MSQNAIQHTNDIAEEVASTPVIETSAGEEKRPNVTQWKPNVRTDAPEKREIKDYTSENSDPDGAVSFCLPFVHQRVRPQKVFAVFRGNTYIEVDDEITRVNFGFIERIDMIERKDNHKTCFVHLAEGRFNKNDFTTNILSRMAQGERFKVYNDREQRYFWWMSISKAKRPEDQTEENSDENGTSADITFDLQ